MGHVISAVCKVICGKGRLGRTRIAQRNAVVTGSAGPGPGIGLEGSAAIDRAAAVKRNRRSGPNPRLGRARFRNRVRKPGGDRDCYRIGDRGHIRTVRHNQREDMGHVISAVCKVICGKGRLGRTRIAQRNAVVTGSAGPGPGIGLEGSAAIDRAAAVKRNRRSGPNPRLGRARFRNRVRKPGGDRDCYRIGDRGAHPHCPSQPARRHGSRHQRRLQGHLR